MRRRITANDFINTSDIAFVWSELQRIRDLFTSRLQRTVLLQMVNAGLRWDSNFNAIERNLDALADDGYRPQDMQDTTTWELQGEQYTGRFLSHFDVNRWFISIELLEELIENTANNLLVTGTYTSSTNRDRQRMGRVR